MIDVNRLHREGCLQPSWCGLLQWFRDGQQSASVCLRSEEDRLRLSYRLRIAGGNWEEVSEAVPIVYAPCRYGGKRPYFLCPGVVDGSPCGRRVIKLYGAGRYFLCRHCYDLTYASQNEAAWDRALRRANTIRQRLGGEPGTVAPFPPRPKGMWRRTYERLREEAFTAERLAEETFLARTQELLQRIDNTQRKGSFWS